MTGPPGGPAQDARVAPSKVTSCGALSIEMIPGRSGKFMHLCTLCPDSARLWGDMCDCNVTNSQRISNSMIASAVWAASIGRWEGVHSTQPSEERPPGWM